MASNIATRRMQRELKILSRGGAAPGISVWPRDESRLDLLDAEICGAVDTPYDGGVFRLELNIPSEYPLKPPRVRFVTRIYHPNIDSDGRICLDTLTMPPKGAWKPSINIATLLTTIQALMSSPNPDDGLMVDITDEYRRNPVLFRQKASQWTKQYANPSTPNQTLPPNHSTPSNNHPQSEHNNTVNQPARPSKVKPSPALSEKAQPTSSIPDTDDDDDGDGDDIRPDTSRRLKKKPRLR